MKIIGLDPGSSTGVAQFESGKLIGLDTIAPENLPELIDTLCPSMVILEDSRLQSHVWNRHQNTDASLKLARNLGQIDAWCHLICALCANRNIEVHTISPLGKGAKLDAATFGQVTGWMTSSNQHERDAAMVAWRYRSAKGT